MAVINMLIKNMDNKKLKSEFKAMHQQVYQIGCYGVRDLQYYQALENELIKRDIEVKIVPHISFT